MKFDQVDTIKKNNQVEFRLRSSVDGVNMVLIVSPETGIKKRGNWIQTYKDLFYERTKQRGIKIAISCNGTFCMNEKEWEHFKRCVESTIESK